MNQQVIENVLKRKDWDKIKFYTATSSRTLYSKEKYELDSFAIYIKHDYGYVDIMDLQKIESMEVTNKKNSDGEIPFYQKEAKL